ncbi:MAG: hypothetical protein KF749_11785 [Bacteroidetes bacterium]|nr:hypothetical protein [Bacteroidota bacterium]MCW5894544.1 hypothetical protein [Bacteroidota bacterium]
MMSTNFLHATDILHWKSPWHRFFYFSTAVSFVVFTICLIIIGNVWDNPVLGEDGVLESLSALLYLAALVAALYVAFKVKSRRVRVINILVLAVGFLGFTSEISFGERWFNLTMPVVRGVKIDAVHDFVDLGYQILRDKLPGFVLLLLVAAAALTFVAVVWRFRSSIAEILREREDASLVAWACVVILMAVVIDLDIIQNMFLFLLEELFELAGGIAVATAGFFQVNELRTAAKAQGG